MFCEDCGMKYQMGDLFCPDCGSRNDHLTMRHLENNIPNKVPPKKRSIKPKKGKKKWLVFALVFCILAASTATVVLNPGGIFDPVHEIVYGRSADDVINALENREFEEALRLARDISESSQRWLEIRLVERLEVISVAFVDEEIEYLVAMLELDTIEQMGFQNLTSEIEHTRSFVNDMNSSRIAFNTAQSMVQQGDFVAAIGYYSLVIPEDPNYEAAQEGMRDALGAYRDWVQTEAENYIADGKVQQAFQVFMKALEIFEDDPVLTEQFSLIKQSHISSSIAEATRLMEQGEYIEAERIIAEALQFHSEDEELLQKHSTIIEAYVSSAIIEATALQEGGIYQDAIAVINNALRVAPNHPRLTETRLVIQEDHVSSMIEEAEFLLEERDFDMA